MATTTNMSPETLITVKIALDGAVKKLKLPLRDLDSSVLQDKLRVCLNIAADHDVVLERYSDSLGGYVTLNPANTAVYKALVRAAKAKGKLRLKASTIPPDTEQEQEQVTQAVPAPVQMLQTSRPHLGQGIFQYREARASQALEEAPIPRPFTAPHNLSPETRHAALQACQELAFRTREPATATTAAWSVYCNICDEAMADVHYHCSTCDGGDYDLCEACVSRGNTCPGDDHWLIKRFIKDGKVVTSQTERVSRKTPAPTPDVFAPVPASNSFVAAPVASQDVFAPTRPCNSFVAPVSTRNVVVQDTKAEEPTITCNSCVVVRPERDFVTCTSCADYDLCIECHANNLHGHHPAHEFKPATIETSLSTACQSLLKAGRNVTHNAFCDGCDKKIVGVRHKCLQCPDWDYCNDCIATASSSHPHHRFAALYEQLAEPQPNFVRHFGIYCDGPLCNKKARQSYIQGVRYKCAVCHDTDFCATCEALPGNRHNRTHPLIKFSTPVRNVNITTVNEDVRGNTRSMGDKPVPQNAPTPVQTVADIAPTEEKPRQSPQPLDGDVSTRAPAVPINLNASFVRDSIADGTVIAPGSRFTQIWTLRNEGPHPWPAGCSVRYVGGDNMLNVENGRPASVASIAEAIESSVVAREVAVGEEIAFRITLKAPMREGRSISYWRLKSADGTPFGHRLWCDIVVRGAKLDAPPVTPERAIDALRQHHQSRLQAIQAVRQHELQALHSQAEGDRKVRSFRSWLSQADEAARMENGKARMEMMRRRIMQSRAQQLQAHAAMRDATKCAEHMPEAAQPVVTAGATAAEEAVVPAAGHGAEETVVPAKDVPAVESARNIQEPVAKTVVPAVEAALVVEEPIAETVPVADDQGEAPVDSASSSQMIFPKLEKESPASSMIASTKGKAAYVENEDGEVEQSAVPASPSIAEPLEDFDDLEVLSMSAASDDSDDGFLTDEEYDILDASDHETVVSP